MTTPTDCQISPAHLRPLKEASEGSSSALSLFPILCLHRQLLFVRNLPCEVERGGNFPHLVVLISILHNNAFFLFLPPLREKKKKKKRERWQEVTYNGGEVFFFKKFLSPALFPLGCSGAIFDGVG